MTLTVDQLSKAGQLLPMDVQFARALTRLSGDAHPDVALAAALASHFVLDGHVCADLTRLSGALSADPDGLEAQDRIEHWTWPARPAWFDRLRGSALLAGQDAPLVLDDAGRLYLRRYYELEARLAKSLLARTESPDAPVDAAWLERVLDRHFGAAGAEKDLQREAVAMAVRRPFAIISGGPGTGKTSTVVKLLAVLIERSVARGASVPRVLMAAPTGKAAARLSQSILSAVGNLSVDEQIREAIPREASTLHRLLGVRRDRATAFRHDAEHPLPGDIFLVDEASMVDLALMSRFLDAVPPQARVILLGDRDQLASVEAGAVLGDLCAVGRRHPKSSLGRSVVHLEKSYRYAAGSGLGALARAINNGADDEALALLNDPSTGDVQLLDPGRDVARSASFRRTIVEGYEPLGQAREGAAALAALDRFRVLCAHRRGPSGVEGLNPTLFRILHAAGVLNPLHDDEAFAGRPILVTRNDPAQDLYNGDVGVMWEVEPGEGLRCLFPSEEGAPRALSLGRLPPHETVFAMSVHKSQGSEFDRIAVVLPAVVTPLMTRELLYTAVTRARTAVTLFGSEDVLRHGINTVTHRSSGLADRLAD